METKRGQQADDLISELLGTDRVRSIDFFRLIRVLEASCADRFPRIGHSWSPRDDPVRFCQPPFQGTAASTIERFVKGDDTSPPRLYVNFFGLFGPHGPLPWHLTEYARIRRSVEYEAAMEKHEATTKKHNAELEKASLSADLNSAGATPTAPAKLGNSEEEWDSVINAFCDVFHHRLISFFYRAWASHRRVTELDREEVESSETDRRFEKYVGSFSGLGLSCLRGKRDRLPGSAKLYQSGWLGSPSRPPEGLQSILQDFLNIETNIVSFVGHWIEAKECRNDNPLGFCQLGNSKSTGTLGRNCVIGSRSWERQLKFRVRLGPMDRDNYVRLLPPVSELDANNSMNPDALPNRGDSIRRVRAWVRTYVGFEYFWDVQLVLQAESVPDMVLGNSGELGHTTWLKHHSLSKEHPFMRDAADLVFEPETITESSPSIGKARYG